ncbi:MAG TPA: DUF5916 domain-containing protein [Acidobacteriota bacterium]|jgi:hypothetical protein|nr:DUF5916 domain-containing protein [Acidobacteriota bacterium]
MFRNVKTPFLAVAAFLATTAAHAGRQHAISGPADKKATAAPAKKVEPSLTKLQVKAVRLAEPVVIDGVLSEPVWQSEFAISEFTQRDPKEGEPATEKTIVRVAYNNTDLYIGARMYDANPAGITGRLGRRDAGLESDEFVFFIDPYHDGRSGFFFSINPAGSIRDGTLYNDSWQDDSWDGVWEGKARIDDKGWTAEIRIPYSQLRFEKKDGYIWGVNFRRFILRKNEDDYLVFTPKNGSGFVSRFVDMVGVEGIATPRRIEVTPYATVRAAFTQHAAGDPFNDGSAYHAATGADLKIGFGSNLTLDATVNPDFGQVEVDPAVVNLSDVETFFEEKRLFFIEGANTFRFGHGGASNYWGFNWGDPDFFYTRRIGRAPQGHIPTADFVSVPSGTGILGAGKLTGKIDGWNIGVLNAFTNHESGEYQLAGQRFHFDAEPATYYGVFRLQKEYTEGRKGLGFISTIARRHFTEEQLKNDINSGSSTFGVDGWKFLDANKTWVVAGWAGMSHVTGTEQRILALQQDSQHYLQRPDARHVRLDPTATSLTGFAGRVYLNKEKGNFFMNSAFGFIDPKFDTNDLGFMWRGDVINWHVGAGYRWVKPGRFTRSAEALGAIFRSYDFDRNPIWSGYFLLGVVQFLNYYNLETVFAYNPSGTVNNRLTRGGPLTLNQPGWEASIFARSDSRKSWVLGVGANTEQYANGASRSLGIGPSVEWKPASNFSLRIDPRFNRNHAGTQWVGAFDSASAAATFGKRYVFAELEQTSLSAGIRLNWTFTPKISLQFYGQPLISAGDYHGFKELARPRSYDFNLYGKGSSTFDGLTHIADPDGPGPAESINLGNPDFNFKSFRANAVWRWEYRPGSTMYVVWTQSRSDVEDIGKFNLGHSLGRLWSTPADNIFMVKLTYWGNR